MQIGALDAGVALLQGAAQLRTPVSSAPSGRKRAFAGASRRESDQCGGPQAGALPPAAASAHRGHIPSPGVEARRRLKAALSTPDASSAANTAPRSVATAQPAFTWAWGTAEALAAKPRQRGGAEGAGGGERARQNSLTGCCDIGNNARARQPPQPASEVAATVRRGARAETSAAIAACRPALARRPSYRLEARRRAVRIRMGQADT